MAKGKKKGSGPGRGRKNPPRDPETGRLLGKEAGGAAPVSSPAAPAPPKPSTPEMTPAGKTEMPEEIKKEISGFRKAMSERLKEMGETESGVQETVLDGLRNTAERLVQQNEDIFGKKGEKTVDQSAAYEIIEGVVALSEQAAAAKAVEQKRKILQRLKTYKAVVEKVIVGKDPRLSAISGKILEMIESIETPLSKESGMMASAKEKITDFAKKIPEKLARKIPLVGGLLGGYLQRRREKKEEEAAALSDLTQQISRAGRTSLYGKAGKGGFDSGGEGGVETEPPIPGTTPLSEIMSPESSGGGFGIDKQTNQNIQSIKNDLGSVLSHIKEIKEFVLGRFDPAQEETKAEEAKRENEDMLFDMMSSLKGDKRKIEKGGAAASTKSGGIMDMLMNALGGGAVSAELISALAGIALPVLSVLAAAAGGAAIGYMIYKNWIEPAQQKQQQAVEEALGSKEGFTQKELKTDKGESVYRTKDGFVSASQLEEKIKSAKTPEEKQALQDVKQEGPVKETYDAKTGLLVGGVKGVESGMSVEQMNVGAQVAQERAITDPSAVAFEG